MKYFVTTVLILYCLACTAQTTISEDHNYLSREEMFSDYDYFTNILFNCIPVLSINEKVFGLNTTRDIISNRDLIDNIKSKKEFAVLISESLSLVQDEHTTLVNQYRWMNNNKYFWSSQIRALNNHITKKSVKNTLKYKEMIKTVKKRIDLPIMYHKGKYLIYKTFKHNKKVIPMFSVLTKINNNDAESEIQKLTSQKYLHKDYVNQILYDTEFYKHTSFYLHAENNKMILEFITPENKTLRIDIRESDYVSFSKIKKYNTKQKRIFIIDNTVLYIRLPRMYPTRSAIAYYTDYLKSINNADDLEAVIIDIRGNGGGSDLAWKRLLKNIIAEPIVYTDNLAMIESDVSSDYLQAYGYKKKWNKFITNIKSIPDKELIVRKLKYKIRPNIGSIRFRGPIYVVVDNNVYSSAGLFATQCDYNAQLISIGAYTFSGGSGMGPWVFTLPHSQLSFRISQYVDLCSISNLVDTYHAFPEVKVNLDIVDKKLYHNYEGDVYTKEYLISSDPILKYILDHIKQADSDK